MSKKQNQYHRKFVFLIVFILCILLAYALGMNRGQTKQSHLQQKDQLYIQSLEQRVKSLRDELDNTKSLKVTN